MTTRRDFGALAMGLAALPIAALPGRAFGHEHAVLDLYMGFLNAQNDRDLMRVKASLWNSPEFLWVSDGRPFWGPDTLVERMSGFQKAEVWRVEPDLDTARVVEIAPDASYLFLRLVLVIGAAANPDRLPWLVGVVCRRESEVWRIAALFTSVDKIG